MNKDSDKLYINIKIIICAFTLFIAAAAVPIYMPVTDTYATSTDINAANSKKDKLEEQKKKTQEMLDDLGSLKSDAAAYVKQLDGNLSSINEEIDSINTRIDNKQTEIKKTQESLVKAQKDSDDQYSSMKLRIKYMYEKGDTSFLDMIIQSKDISQFLSRTEYIAKITEYDRKLLLKYGQTRDDISASEEKLKSENSDLLVMKDDVALKQVSAQALLDNKKNELSGYNDKISDAQGDLSEYEKQIKAQDDTIKNIEAEIKKKEIAAKKQAEAAGKTYNTVKLGDIHFSWPCPSSSVITCAFGSREAPTEGASTYHQGIDIGAKSGASINAAASGTVIISTYSTSAGNYIMINHGGGVYTVYMHCSKLLVSVGDEVKAGDTIAKVGTTGYSTGPHLHFGIRSNGTYINPSNYVSP